MQSAAVSSAVNSNLRAAPEVKPVEKQNPDIEPVQLVPLDEHTDEVQIPLFPPAEDVPTFIFKLFDDPNSSKGSLVISTIVMVLIVASSVSFIVASLPKYKFPKYGEKEEDQPKFFEVFEDICIYCFTVEYLLRILCAPFVPWNMLAESEICDREGGYASKIVYFIVKPYNVIDLVAILPYYVTMIAGGGGQAASLSILRILRLGRVFRIFKLGKHSKDMYMLTEVMLHSFSALTMMFFMGLIMSVVFGCLMYYLERGTWNDEEEAYLRPKAFGTGTEPSPFESIPVAMWWVFCTTTTVGYGEIYPTTTLGRIVAVICMNLGILGIALPITVIGQKFAEVFAEKEALKRMSRRSSRRDTTSDFLRQEDMKVLINNIETNLDKLRTLVALQGERLESAVERRGSLLREIEMTEATI